MRRASTAHNPGVSLFPFLAVLICTMGVMMLLLVIINRPGAAALDDSTPPPDAVFQEGGDGSAAVLAAAGRTAGESASRDDASSQASRDQLKMQISKLELSREKSADDLRSERLRLATLEDGMKSLRDKWQQVKKIAGDLQDADKAKHHDVDEIAAAIAELKANLGAMHDQIIKAVDAARVQPPAYAIVPYDGASGTRRQPIYIECRSDAIVLQPEGIEFAPQDFKGPNGPGNPLESTVRAARDYLVGGTAPVLGREPYPLLIVRSDGILAFYLARSAMQSWSTDYGYELVDADQKLVYQQPIPQLAQIERAALADARARYAWFASTDTGKHEADHHQQPVYRVAANGGSKREGEASLGDDDSPGDGFGSGSAFGNSPSGGVPSHSIYTSGMAAAGSGGLGFPGGNPGTGAGIGMGTGSGSGSGIGAGGIGNGAVANGAPGSSGARTGWVGSGVSGSGMPGSGIGAGAGGPASSAAGNSVSGIAGGPSDGIGGASSGAASNDPRNYIGLPGTGSGGTNRLPGPGGYGASYGSNIAESGSSSNGTNGGAPSVVAYTGTGAGLPGSFGSNGTSPAIGGGGSPNGPGSPGGLSSSPFDPSATPPSTNMPSSATLSQAGDSHGSAGQANGDDSSGGASSNMSLMVNGHSQQPRQSSDVYNTYSTPYPLDTGPQMPHIGESNLPPPQQSDSQPQKPPPDTSSHHDPFALESFAEQRGRNWTLPSTAKLSTPISRTIHVLCRGDCLILQPGIGNSQPQVIPFGPRTADSVDKIVAAVWDYAKGWGIAGQKMYWKPRLELELGPYGERRYDELQSLMANSGLEIVNKSTTTASTGSNQIR